MALRSVAALSFSGKEGIVLLVAPRDPACIITAFVAGTGGGTGPVAVREEMAALKLIPDTWKVSAARRMDGAALLRYRSNLLGSDRRVTNFGGGNTSAKLPAKDPLTGERVTVLWVKGSGGDLGSLGIDGFATLYQEKLEGLRKLYRGPQHEDEMVDCLPHCTFNLNPRSASIDTPLHAFVPRRHVDHMHPDAIIAIAASKDSKKLTREIYGDGIGWLPWRRPGFELGLWLADYLRDNPLSVGAVLESHGLFTWHDDAHACYRLTIDTINRAILWFARKTRGRAIFGGVARKRAPYLKRIRLVAGLMPALRGEISAQARMVGHFDESPPVLEFVNSRQVRELARQGTSCPDHFLRTKIRPLVLENAGEGLPALLASLPSQLADYRKDYVRYYGRCRQHDSPPMRDPNAVVYLLPGIGMITFARDKATARHAAEYYVNAINVMRGASVVSTYCGLPEREAFNIEYWRLEEAKLRRLPAPGALAGRIALVTGGAGGIGRACADRLLCDGCSVMICDSNVQALTRAENLLVGTHGADRVRAVHCDVRDEKKVAAMFSEIAWQYGGLDILVSNAGMSSAAPLEQTSLDMWHENHDLMVTGYFLIARSGLALFKRQKLGGSVIFIASKNGVAASVGASAYCAAKAAEIHLARCLALEGADHGVRANVVNPDAVLRGSGIWAGSWRNERAKTYGVKPDELEDFYRARSLLKRSVFPEDVAEAVRFLAGDGSAKTTGAIIAVDAGNPVAFGR